MRRVQIDHLPDHVHATLRRRAEAAGLSLQDYLRAELEELARRSEAFAPPPAPAALRPYVPTAEDLARPAQRIADYIREEREAREEHLASLMR